MIQGIANKLYFGWVGFHFTVTSSLILKGGLVNTKVFHTWQPSKKIAAAIAIINIDNIGSVSKGSRAFKNMFVKFFTCEYYLKIALFAFQLLVCLHRYVGLLLPGNRCYYTLGKLLKSHTSFRQSLIVAVGLGSHICMLYSFWMLNYELWMLNY